MPDRRTWYWPILFIWLAAGCSFDPSGVGDDSPPIDGSTIDGSAIDGSPIDGNGIDASPIDGETCTAWAALNVDPCDGALPAPTALTIGGGTHTFDTDTGLLDGETPPSAVVAQPGGPDLRVVNVTSLDVVGTLEISGSMAVVFVVHGDATIMGTIDASARADLGGRRPGPGGNSSACGNSDGNAGAVAGNVNAGGGGGGGGAYGDDGGDGGDGEGAGGAKGGKGTKNGDADLEPLRGGCHGGRGGDDGDGTVDTGGPFGDGGGAVEITALGAIDVSGTITAGGTGGSGGLGRAGGGGGGSGGAILLDGDTVTLANNAAVCANGGGGGEGATVALTGESGADATCSETSAAAGGSLLGDGGNGGDGGVEAASAGQAADPGANGGGGGGGGGGVGRIRIRGRASAATIPDQATVSPAAVP